MGPRPEHRAGAEADGAQGLTLCPSCCCRRATSSGQTRRIPPCGGAAWKTCLCGCAAESGAVPVHVRNSAVLEQLQCSHALRTVLCPVDSARVCFTRRRSHVAVPCRPHFWHALVRQERAGAGVRGPVPRRQVLAGARSGGRRGRGGRGGRQGEEGEEEAPGAPHRLPVRPPPLFKSVPSLLQAPRRMPMAVHHIHIHSRATRFSFTSSRGSSLRMRVTEDSHSQQRLAVLGCRFRFEAIPGHSTVSAKVVNRHTSVVQPRRQLAAAGARSDGQHNLCTLTNGTLTYLCSWRGLGFSYSPQLHRPKASSNASTVASNHCCLPPSSAGRAAGGGGCSRREAACGCTGQPGRSGTAQRP